MPAKQYFKTCLEEYKRTTKETNQTIAARMGDVPNWLTQLSRENYPQCRPSLTNFEKLCTAIPTLDRELLLAHILQDDYPAASRYIAAWMQCPHVNEEIAFIEQVRIALTDIGIRGHWELGEEDLSASARALARLIASLQACGAQLNQSCVAQQTETRPVARLRAQLHEARVTRTPGRVAGARI